MTTTQPLTPTPDRRFLPWPAHRGETVGAHLEFDARPGSLLGGPNTARATRTRGLTRVPADQLAARHLEYLRVGCRTVPGLWRELQHLAHVSLNSPNVIAIVAENEAVAGNVINAVNALATRILEQRAAADAPVLDGAA